MIYNGIESGIALALSFVVNFSIIVGSSIAGDFHTVHEPSNYLVNTVAGAKFYPDDPANPIGLSNASQLFENVFNGYEFGLIFNNTT